MGLEIQIIGARTSSVTFSWLLLTFSYSQNQRKIGLENLCGQITSRPKTLHPTLVYYLMKLRKLNEIVLNHQYFTAVSQIKIDFVNPADLQFFK